MTCFKEVSEIAVAETSGGQLELAGFDSTALRSQVIASEQQAIRAMEYLLGKEGGGVKRFFLLRADYVYFHTTNAGP